MIQKNALTIKSGPLYFQRGIQYPSSHHWKQILPVPLYHAHAKINIGLLIIDRRTDGYHNILTAFHRIALHDEIHLEVDGEIHVSADSPDVPGGPANICFKAVELLRTNLGTSRGASIRITKHIPTGAGLGGGSSDAAVVLRELPHLWGYHPGRKELEAMALQLGADVPFFLRSGSAIGTGRGEILEDFDLKIPYTILTCHPGIAVPTAWAYAQVTPGTQDRTIDLKSLVLEGMKAPHLLMERVHNDFEQPVFQKYPGIRHIKETMIGKGAVYSSLSGSGSSVFGFFEDHEASVQCAELFQSMGYTTSFTSPSGQ